MISHVQILVCNNFARFNLKNSKTKHSPDFLMTHTGYIIIQEAAEKQIEVVSTNCSLLVGNEEVNKS